MKKLPFLISFSLLSSVVILYLIIPSFRDFVKQAFDVLTSDDETLIKQWVSKFKMAGPLTLILLMVIQMFLFVVPNVFVMMVAIVSYGPVWGAVISFLGVFASSSAGYIIGKYLGPVTVNKLLSTSAQAKTTDFIQHY